jgi:hypothetical protein
MSGTPVAPLSECLRKEHDPMKTVAIIAALVAQIIPAAGEVAPFSYEGRSVGASYHYRTASGEADGDLRGFEMETAHGVLAGRIEEVGGYGRITLTHGESGSMAVATFSPPAADGVQDVHMALPDLNDDFYFKVRTDGAEARLVAHSSPDCEAIAAAPLIRAMRDARDGLDRETASIARPPAHLAGVAGAVRISEGLLQLGGCVDRRRADAGACYYDTRTYGACATCCDDESNAVGVVCSGAAFACGGPACEMLVGLGCNVAVSLADSVCTAHNCGGKPGNPGCRNPKPPCPGSCMQFCGPGWSSTCGECPLGRECCS